jgi:hypothetical protein
LLQSHQQLGRKHESINTQRTTDSSNRIFSKYLHWAASVCLSLCHVWTDSVMKPTEHGCQLTGPVSQQDPRVCC